MESPIRPIQTPLNDSLEEAAKALKNLVPRVDNCWKLSSITDVSDIDHTPPGPPVFPEETVKLAEGIINDILDNIDGHPILSGTVDKAFQIRSKLVDYQKAMKNVR